MALHQKITKSHSDNKLEQDQLTLLGSRGAYLIQSVIEQQQNLR